MSLTAAETLIVDVKLAVDRRRSGYVSELWEESHLKGYSTHI